MSFVEDLPDNDPAVEVLTTKRVKRGQRLVTTHVYSRDECVPNAGITDSQHTSNTSTNPVSTMPETTAGNKLNIQPDIDFSVPDPAQMKQNMVRN